MSPWTTQIAMLPVRRPDPDQYTGRTCADRMKMLQAINRETIVDMISNEPMGMLLLTKRTGLCRETVRTHLIDLVKEGRVVADTSFKRRRWRAACL